MTQIRKADPADAEPAIGFYRKQGFRRANRTPDRDLGDEIMWMSLDLQAS